MYQVGIYDYEKALAAKFEVPEFKNPERDETTGELVAYDRAEDDYCEKGTQGCAIHHTRDSDCQTW